MVLLDTVRTIATTSLASMFLVLACDGPPAEPEAAPGSAPAPAPAPGLVDQYQQAKRETMCIDAKQIAMAVELQRVTEPGACPTDVAALVQAKLLARVPDSAPRWAIACNGDEIVVSAPGADGELGTDDDVVQGGPRATCKR